MELVKKDVRYLNKDFAQFRQNLINFTRQYFPNTYSDFNESSPGMMFIEMASYVGDVLSYYTDQSFRESLLKTANEDSNVLMLSQLFGYKPKLNSAAIVTLDVYQLIPSIGSGVDARPCCQQRFPEPVKARSRYRRHAVTAKGWSSHRPQAQRLQPAAIRQPDLP